MALPYCVAMCMSEFPKKFQLPIYISPESCIMVPEQSRRRRVKCHRDGEFARRTKEFFHDAVTAPAVA